MPVVDTLRVNFEAHWTGSNAINQMASDLKKVSSIAGDVDKAYRSIGSGGAANFDGISRSTAMAAVKIQHLESVSRSLSASMQGIGDSVRRGEMTLEEGAQQYRAFGQALQENEAALNQLRPTYDGATASVKDHSLTIGELVSKYRAFIFSATAVIVGLKGVAAALSAIRNAARDGAGINQTAESFDNLARNIVDVPDLLIKMREASRGTISDIQLMGSFMTLVAGTSEDFGKQLARQAPQLLEIAKAAQKLNPTLGDTSFLFDSLARGIKRSEIRILDNLGIIVKVGDANKQYAEQIGKSVEALTAEERQIALLNKTLEVGSRLIEQAGGNVNSLTDAYLQSTAAQENATASLKGWLAAIGETAAIDLARTLDATATGFDIMTERIIANRAELRGFIDDIKAANDLGTTRGKVDTFFDFGDELDQIPTNQAQNRRAIEQEMEEIVYSITSGAVSIEHAQRKLEQAFGVGNANFFGLGTASPYAEIIRDGQSFVVQMSYLNNDIAAAIQNYRRAISNDNWESYYRGQSSSIADDALNERRRAWEADQQAQADWLSGRVAMGKASLAAAAAEEEANRTWLEGVRAINNEILEANTERIIELAEYRDAIEDLRRGAFSDIFDDGESDLMIGNARNLGQAIVTTTNVTDDQKRALEAWREEMADAADAVWNLENGVGTFGVDQDKLGEKLANARGEMEHYRALIEGVESQLVSSTRSFERYINIDDEQAFRGVIEAMGEAGALAGNMIDVSEALGLMSPQAAEAARALGLLQTVMTTLGEQLASGIIEPGEVQAALDGLITELESGKTTAEIELDIEFQINKNKQWNFANELLPEGDRQADIPIDANLSPFQQVVGQISGLLPGNAGNEPVKALVDADMSPAEKTLNEFREMIREQRIPIQAVLEIDTTALDNLPGSTGGAVGGGGGGGDPWFHSGGFVTGHGAGDVRAVLQAGEYVMRRSAVNGLGVDLLDRLNSGQGFGTSNAIQITFNNYGQGSPGQTAPIAPVLIQTNDPLTAIANTLRRGGVTI